MAVKILIPTPLRPYAGRKESVEVDAASVGELLERLVTEHADLRRHLFTEEGALRSFVNVYVNDEDIRYLDAGDTALAADDVVRIIPSIAGGTAADDPGATLGGTNPIGFDPAATPGTNGDEAGVCAAPSPVPAAGPAGAFGIVPHPDVRLSKEEILRYSRHLIMSEVGMEGQLRLKSARVLLVGTGGLGAPLGLYLAAAGVGRLGLVDFDTVEFTNLQRQITFGTGDVDRPKLEAARERLAGLNPGIEIVTHDARLSSENAVEILRDYDIVVDGTDNFPTRYLVNDACVLLGKPNIYGSIFRFEGQCTIFALDDGPCYRCLYPEPPPPGLVPSCAEGGVLGVLPGIVGSIQANETIKLIIGRGEPLKGRLLLFDALAMRFHEVTIRRNPDCPVCGTRPSLTALIDYDEFCGLRGEEPSPEGNVPEITPAELERRLGAGEKILLLDVREPHEYEVCNLGGHLIPLAELPERAHELDTAWEIVVHCRSGVRSAEAVSFLRSSGFSRVSNLAGGILAWADEVDPSMPKY